MKEMAREAVQAKKGEPGEDMTTQNSVCTYLCNDGWQTKSWRPKPEQL
jgi:hypothetical protein